MPSRNEENDELLNLLKKVFGKNNVEKEWDVAANSEDAYTRNLYVPRIDYAIRPFNRSNDSERRNKDLEDMQISFHNHKDLFTSLTEYANYPENFNHDFRFNSNPRCFVAIEVEYSTSMKHRMGSMINASAMGKVAIMVAETSNVMKSFERIANYLKYLERIKKLDTTPQNLILIEMKDLKKLLSEYIENR